MDFDQLRRGQLVSLGGLEVVSGGLDRDSHDFAIGRNVENLFAVAAPGDLFSAGGRDLDFARQAGKRNDEDLILAGFFRDWLRVPCAASVRARKKDEKPEP
jgi:hypothetical protein